ncbi:MAG: MATE family efflux transporter [Terrimicrobiaceae bacterium]
MAQPENSRKEPLSALVSVATLAAPMLLGQAGQVLLQLTDTLMLGHVGPVALAGAGLAGNFLMFALYFAYGALGAVAPRVARAFGSGDMSAVGVAMRAGGLLGAMVGLLISVSLSAATWALPRLGQPLEVVAVTGNYLLLLAWSMPFALVSIALGQAVEAVNRAWPVFAIMAGSVALNAGLNFILIFGHIGFPPMGLEGAGWATLAARIFQMITLLGWLAFDRGLVDVRILRPQRADSAEVWNLFRLGLPVAAQDVLEGGSFAVGAIMLGWVGTEALAANQVTIGIASLAWMFPLALAAATSVRVAQASGAGDPAAARRAGLTGVGIGVALMGICAVIYISFGRVLAGFFTDDPGVAELTGLLVTIAGIYQISDAVQSISLGSLRGLSDNKVPMIANAVCYWVLSIPTVYLLTFPLGWGAVGVWIGYLPWMALTGLFFLVRFFKRTAS